MYLNSCSVPQQTHQPAKGLRGSTQDEPSNRIKQGQKRHAPLNMTQEAGNDDLQQFLNPELMQETQNGNADVDDLLPVQPLQGLPVEAAQS